MKNQLLADLLEARREAGKNGVKTRRQGLTVVLESDRVLVIDSLGYSFERSISCGFLKNKAIELNASQFINTCQAANKIDPAFKVKLEKNKIFITGRNKKIRFEAKLPIIKGV